jgi:hypothetical protein
MLNIVVNCTNRKAIEPVEGLLLRNLRFQDMASAHKLWAGNIDESKSLLPALDMYQGEYWSVVKGISANKGVRVFVLSAGLGIFEVNKLIPSYGATFTHGCADSIAEIDKSLNPFETCRRWFVMRSNHLRDTYGGIDYLKVFGNYPTIFCLGKSYMQIIADDLSEFDLAIKEKIILMGSKPNGANGLNVIDTPGKLRLTLGGTLSTVSVRTLRDLLSVVDTSASPNSIFKSMRDYSTEINRMTADLPKYNRAQLNDFEVTAFITSELSANNTCSSATLLRKLRDSGFACEQNRFKKIFNDFRSLSE